MTIFCNVSHKVRWPTRNRYGVNALCVLIYCVSICLCMCMCVCKTALARSVCISSILVMSYTNDWKWTPAQRPSESRRKQHIPLESSYQKEPEKQRQQHQPCSKVLWEILVPFKKRAQCVGPVNLCAQDNYWAQWRMCVCVFNSKGNSTN